MLNYRPDITLREGIKMQNKETVSNTTPSDENEFTLDNTPGRGIVSKIYPNQIITLILKEHLSKKPYITSQNAPGIDSFNNFESTYYWPTHNVPSNSYTQSQAIKLMKWNNDLTNLIWMNYVVNGNLGAFNNEELSQIKDDIFKYDDLHPGNLESYGTYVPYNQTKSDAVKKSNLKKITEVYHQYLENNEAPENNLQTPKSPRLSSNPESLWYYKPPSNNVENPEEVSKNQNTL